ncbi:MAG TPA: hypothetical protein VEX68_27245 [Bryobacteraceae bacterium]|nr:hypothetical protein [Bryobacteraceae bacterium]
MRSSTIFRHRVIGRLCSALGVLCLAAGSILYVASRNLFDAHAFGIRVSESLFDPGVANYASQTITDSIIKSRPNLIAIRPFIQATASSLVSARPFRALAGTAAQQAHRAAFSEGGQRLVLSIPDLQILVHSALSQTSPELAGKIPKQIQTAIASLGENKSSQLLVDVWRLGRRSQWLWKLLFPCGAALLLVGLWATSDRQRGLVWMGKEIIGAGVILAMLIPAAKIAAAAISSATERDLVRGLIHAFFGDLNSWAWFFCGLGILVAAGASSQLERVDPLGTARNAIYRLITPPAFPSYRLAWGLLLLVIGLLAAIYPLEVLRGAIILTGILSAYVGVREVFRVVREAPKRGSSETDISSEQSPALPFIAAIALVPILGAFWIIRKDAAIAVAPEAATLTCNGSADLCDRKVDEVAFAGTHNAMSNQSIPGWMFPHQEAAIPQQLTDGIRALLFDVHRGFAGGARIKTDMSTEPSAEKIIAAVGQDGYNAALRIRNRLVGVDEGNPSLYLCHGFCELGAYTLTPLLTQIRGFLVSHPDDVLLMIIEDYAAPAEIARAFDESGVTDFVYQGPGQPRWPTLRDLITSGRRVIVFIESGRPGVGWLRPAFESIRETPYTFHKPEEFTCTTNRGGDLGSLFLMNNWIDTTPAPKPSNAAIVNSFAALSQRATLCTQERFHMPNIIAVDFYRTGDLLRVVDRVNSLPLRDPVPAR